MANDDEKLKPVFPPEYAHLEEPFKEAQEKVNQIDQAIKNLPTKKGPTLSFRPPGADDANKAYKPHNTSRRLNNYRDQVSRKFEERVRKETKDADVKMASQLKSIVKHKLSRGEFKDKTPDELKAVKGEVKKSDKSFGYMESLHFSRFKNEKEEAKGNGNRQDDKKELSLDEMSDKFMERLSRHPDKGKQEPTPKKDAEEPNME